MKSAIRGLVVCSFLIVKAQSATVAVFDNATYVNTSGGPSASSDAIQAVLTSFGHTVVTFTGTSASSFSAAASTADLILFPDQLSAGQLATDLTPAAKTALSNYVSSGGGLITVGDNAHRLLNAVFYPTCDFVTIHCFASSGTGGPSYLTAGAAATPFAGSPATLSNPPGPNTALNLFAFTPAGGMSIYRDQVGGFPNSTTVLLSPFGNGNYGYLAWNFAEAAPLGTLDGGWNGALNTMVQTVNAVPEPGSFLLLSGGLALCFGVRRARS